MQVLEDGYMIQCPPLLLAPVILVAAVLLFGGIQFAAYVFPFFSQSWIFNEMIGFIPGIFLGFLWGRIICMLIKAQSDREHRTR